MRAPIDKNAGKHPEDPEYDRNFDYDDALDAYEQYCDEQREIEKVFNYS